jgi:hypothetical protein
VVFITFDSTSLAIVAAPSRLGVPLSRDWFARLERWLLAFFSAVASTSTLKARLGDWRTIRRVFVMVHGLVISQRWQRHGRSRHA